MPGSEAVRRSTERTVYIDGVDENIARLPAGWRARAVARRIDVAGRILTAVAPCPEDLILRAIGIDSEIVAEIFIAENSKWN
jgi:hypothetical protein